MILPCLFLSFWAIRTREEIKQQQLLPILRVNLKGLQLRTETWSRKVGRTYLEGVVSTTEVDYGKDGERTDQAYGRGKCHHWRICKKQILLLSHAQYLTHDTFRRMTPRLNQVFRSCKIQFTGEYRDRGLGRWEYRLCSERWIGFFFWCSWCFALPYVRSPPDLWQQVTHKMIYQVWRGGLYSYSLWNKSYVWSCFWVKYFQNSCNITIGPYYSWLLASGSRTSATINNG